GRGVKGGGPDFLAHSHGEGFMRFFDERCRRQGIFIFDEPESALSPSRQIEFLKLLRRMDGSNNCQVIMATHSPILMAYPNARLLQLSKYGLESTSVEQTGHYRLMREFCADPAASWKPRWRILQANRDSLRQFEPRSFPGRAGFRRGQRCYEVARGRTLFARGRNCRAIGRGIAERRRQRAGNRRAWH